MSKPHTRPECEVRGVAVLVRGQADALCFRTEQVTMPDDSYEDAARLTVKLVDHGHTPDQLSEALLEKLIEMAAESKLNIWHRETGLSVASLTALYRLYETGAGYCHSRIYGDYELGREK